MHMEMMEVVASASGVVGLSASAIAGVVFKRNLDHGEKIARLEAQHDAMNSDIAEVKRDVKEILQRLPPRP